MTHLEFDIEKYGSRLARLEIGSNTIQDNINRLDDVDSKIESVVDSIQVNSNSVTDLGQQILDLDLDTESVFINRARINELDLNLKSANISLIDFGDRIVDLESDKTIVQNNSNILAELVTSMKSATLAIKIQNDSLAALSRRLLEQETTIRDIQNNSDRIAELGENIRAVNSVILRQNDSIADVDKRTMNFETFTAITQNNSHFITGLDSSIRSALVSDKKHNDTLIIFEKRMAELETNISTLLNVSEIVSELDANMRLVKSATCIQDYNDTLTDIEFRINELETNISVQSNRGVGDFDSNITSVVHEHDATLADISKRTVVLERNVSAYRVIVNDLESTMGSLGFAIQSSNDFMNNVLIKVIEIESNVSLIGNNSDRIIELHSELESVTSSIKDHNATLQDVISMIGNNSDIIIELYSELESVTSTIQDLNATLQDVETRLNLTSVGDEKSAFTVHGVTAGLSPGTIRFTAAITNIGGHYSHSSGTFTCQYPGIYVFILHIFKATGHIRAHCNIKKNGAKMTIINSHTADNDVASFDGVSNSVILNLDQGDVVNLGSCSSIDTFYKGWETSFPEKLSNYRSTCLMLPSVQMT